MDISSAEESDSTTASSRATSTLKLPQVPPLLRRPEHLNRPLYEIESDSNCESEEEEPSSKRRRVLRLWSDDDWETFNEVHAKWKKYHKYVSSTLEHLEKERERQKALRALASGTALPSPAACPEAPTLPRVRLCLKTYEKP